MESNGIADQPSYPTGVKRIESRSRRNVDRIRISSEMKTHITSSVGCSNDEKIRNVGDEIRKHSLCVTTYPLAEFISK
ncbi:hypothetical protein T03_4653 [Trichinella britovi]|uniref:Uncharacterized protein n=1 Tax=Trichinella britovi TaxID=45882 RepID=A0A0V1D0X3_TRIBR|nr:hypothetical protein T03_4653 [Trichinella britovi]